MLSRNKRLNLKKDFSWVASGRKEANSLVKLFIRFGDNKTPRVGIALSKSTFKKATERNRARRLISTGFEALYTTLPEKINIVAMPQANVLKANPKEITDALDDLLKRIKKNEEDSHKTN